MSDNRACNYTVNLRVTMVGPDVEWPDAAERLVRWIEGKRRLPPFRVIGVDLDVAEEPGDERG